MAIVTKTESEIKKVKASNELAPDALETIHNVSKKLDNQKDLEGEFQKTNNSVITEEDSKKYSDTVIARLTKGKRSEFKSFFAKYGITMNSGIEMCIEYVINQVNQENAKISKAGVLNNLR